MSESDKKATIQVAQGTPGDSLVNPGLGTAETSRPASDGRADGGGSISTSSKAEQDNTGIGLHTLVSAAMMWDDEKTALWFDTLNPLLGGVSPNWMLDRGRNDKLGRFIRACLDENSPPAAPTQTAGDAAEAYARAQWAKGHEDNASETNDAPAFLAGVEWQAKHAAATNTQEGTPSERKPSALRPEEAGNRTQGPTLDTPSAGVPILKDVLARYEQNAKGYRMGWSEVDGFGLIGDRKSGGRVDPKDYEQVISALLCCTADIPKLLERVTQAETALADKKDIIQAFKKQNRELLALQAPLATPDAWDQARAYVEAQDYVNDENRNAAGNGYVAGWRDRGEVAPAAVEPKNWTLKDALGLLSRNVAIAVKNANCPTDRESFEFLGRQVGEALALADVSRPDTSKGDK